MALFERLGHADELDVSTLNNHFERAAEPLMDLDSDYKQMKYFSETGFFIKPETQQFPGISYVQRLDASTGNTIVESCQTRTASNSTFDIREILRQSGGSALIASLERDRHLSLKERRQMVRLLVSHLMEKFGESLTAEIKKEMALALTNQFPCLKNSEGRGY
ncbi:hypothetical protein QQF64_011247 [Cirrhinus molitorella]|uniref:Uncharacterized protein n=1 Tax=Cirrhinus molitorella TaxID=172907 RepID=A0ABR3M2U8_9TELE